MTYATVNEIAVEQIPVIDIANLFTAEPAYREIGDALLAAAESIGFFYVSNHSVKPSLVEAAFAQSRQFFAASNALKDSVLAEQYHRGWISMGGAKMEGQARSDLKESFIWGVDYPADNADFVAGNELLPPNRWPSQSGMRSVLTEYLDEAHRTGVALLRAIATSLDADQDAFVGRFARPISRGSLIHYPPQPGDLGDDQFGVSPHTDYGTLTLLAQDHNGGLRVEGINGEWLTAHPIANTLVVNVGDLLTRWSNDRLRSTPHSVVNISGNERYSIAIAMDPDWDTVVHPVVAKGEVARYEDVRCGDYIRGRFDRSFSYRQEAG